MTYQYYELKQSRWIEIDIIKASNRKRALSILKDGGKKLKNGCFKLRKVL